MYVFVDFFFFQAEDGIRDLVRSRGLGDVYKRQVLDMRDQLLHAGFDAIQHRLGVHTGEHDDGEERGLSLIHI